MPRFTATLRAALRRPLCNAWVSPESCRRCTMLGCSKTCSPISSLSCGLPCAHAPPPPPPRRAPAPPSAAWVAYSTAAPAWRICRCSFRVSWVCASAASTRRVCCSRSSRRATAQSSRRPLRCCCCCSKPPPRTSARSRAAHRCCRYCACLLAAPTTRLATCASTCFGLPRRSGSTPSPGRRRCCSSVSPLRQSRCCR